MFTGIIQSVGRIASLQEGVLNVEPTPSFIDPNDLEIGESIAINGCCLTLVPGGNSGMLQFDLSPETIARTTFSNSKPGDPVNLERAMTASARFGGHIVSGHVDTVGRVVGIDPQGHSTIYRIEVPNGGEKYLIDKGSITIEGISLTVVEPEANTFKLWIIPHTLEHTNLHLLDVGSEVNVEYDQIAKYLEKLAKSYL